MKPKRKKFKQVVWVDLGFVKDIKFIGKPDTITAYLNKPMPRFSKCILKEI